MTTKHTPGPWRIEDHSDVTDSDESLVTHGVGIADEADANPAHIVRCVNAHDELVAALDMLMDSATEPGVMDVDEWKAHQKRAIAAGRAALAKVWAER